MPAIETGEVRSSLVWSAFSLVGVALLLGCRSPEVAEVEICLGCCPGHIERLWTEEAKSLGALQTDINESDIIVMGVLTAAAPTAIQFEYQGGSYTMAIRFTLEIEEWFGGKRHEHWFDFDTIHVLADYCDKRHWKAHPTAEDAVATMQSVMEANPPALDPSQRRVFFLREAGFGLYAGYLIYPSNLTATDWSFKVNQALTHFRYSNDLDHVWERVNLDDFREMIQDK